jgi:enterochelin esterase family protein
VLVRRVEGLFGRHNLVKGKASAKVEQTTVAWAVVDPEPAQVVRGDGSVIGEMTALGDSGLQVLAAEIKNFCNLGYRVEAGGKTRLAGTVRVEHYDKAPESEPAEGVPQGRLETFDWSDSEVFPETSRKVTVYLPARLQSGGKACLMVWQDGTRHADRKGSLRVPVVMDHLIHNKEMPVTVGVFIDPGRRPNQAEGSKPANRGFEYDSLGDAYVTFLLTEILPEVEKRYGVEFEEDPESWAIGGGSSGGICAFTAAWERPDKFGKVLSWVGSFVDLRGGHVYPAQIRITERKPIRVYLMGGENDLDNDFGHWPIANQRMAAALEYMGYDYRFDWTKCFHGSKGMAPLLPEALRWLWRDVR